jgi:hypothetical protein
MNKKDITKEESFFAVFCIEALAEELKMPGEEVYKLLTEKSTVLDDYVIPCYDTLHTQGEQYIVRELIVVLRERGVIK